LIYPEFGPFIEEDRLTRVASAHSLVHAEADSYRRRFAILGGYPFNPQDGSGKDGACRIAEPVPRDGVLIRQGGLTYEGRSQDCQKRNRKKPSKPSLHELPRTARWIIGTACPHGQGIRSLTIHYFVEEKFQKGIDCTSFAIMAGKIAIF